LIKNLIDTGNMNMKIIKSLLAASLIMTVGVAASVPTVEKTASEYVTQLVTRDSGIVSVHLANPVTNLSGCTLADRFSFNINEAGGESMFTSVTLAMTVGTPIMARLEGCIDVGDGFANNTASKAVSIILQGGPT
jgi:hypothetical protein